MTETRYESDALEGRVRQYGLFYEGMRQALTSEGMPESIRKHAPQYAFALAAARDLDQLPREAAGTYHQSKVLQLLIAAALAETPLKEGLTQGTPVGDLYRKLTEARGQDAPQR